MTGYLRHSRNIRVGVNIVGRTLKRVNPEYHNERKTTTTRHLNPIPYFAEYFGHKLHLDQNEKLIRYGVTEVLAVDGYSSFITAKSVMPIKNNCVIYQEVFRFVFDDGKIFKGGSRDFRTEGGGFQMTKHCIMTS